VKHPWLKRNTRTHWILELHGQGLRQVEIAEVVGCSRANVSKAIEKHAGDAPVTTGFHIAALTGEDHAWLAIEAGRLGCAVRDLARALLADAIEEARHGGGRTGLRTLPGPGDDRGEPQGQDTDPGRPDSQVDGG
jgi:hypothetical protein